jgi:GT2 family glycosyltransferase
MTRSTTPPVVVIPNWNGADELAACLDSLLDQSVKAHIIVVDNGSVDGSLALLETKYPQVELIKHLVNKGYAGGVNPGFLRAIELKTPYVAAFNNDAVADKNWLKQLVEHLDTHPETGAAACKLLSADGTHLDSTGDYYTTWGLPYPRGRGEADTTKYDSQTEIFAASGGASLYRVSMLEEIGLLDEDFFAYYEDVDLSFRAQLAGWKVAYVPSSVVYHDTGTTSRRIKGFTTYQTMKNQPLVLYKNVPRRYLFTVGWRFFIAHCLFFARAVSRGQGWPALKGDAKATGYFFSKFSERERIQKTRKVSDEYIWSIMVHDLPPNAHALRKLRKSWHTLLKKMGKREA